MRPQETPYRRVRLALAVSTILLLAAAVPAQARMGGAFGGWRGAPSGGSWSAGGAHGAPSGGGWSGSWHRGGAWGGQWHGGWNRWGWRGWNGCCSGTRFFFGVGVGVPFWSPYPFFSPYPYPYGYASPVYTPPAVVESPAAYVQPGPQPPQPQYWYYCASSRTYYPYVRECPTGWLQVVPQASPSPAPGAPPQ